MSDLDKKNLWRYIVVGILFGWLAVHMIANGKLAVDKRQTVFITRVDDPLIYWPIVLVAVTMGVLCARKVWKAFFGKDEG